MLHGKLAWGLSPQRFKARQLRSSVLSSCKNTSFSVSGDKVKEEDIFPNGESVKAYLWGNWSKVEEHMYVYAYMHVSVCMRTRLYMYAYISLFVNIKNYNYLVVFLLLSGDSAKEAQTDQKAKKRYFVLLELRTLMWNSLSQRRREKNCYFYSK